MMVLAGADLVLPDRVLPRGSLVIEGDRITAIEPRIVDSSAGSTRIDLTGHLIVPGFIDVHVHGVEGFDVLDGTEALAAVASRLPAYGVTGFCPTSIACDPTALGRFLHGVASAARDGHSELNAAPAAPSSGVDSWQHMRRAAILPAHLESNFINPEYKGAQPAQCLRTAHRASDGDFSGDDILDVIATHRGQVAIVTLAPEIHGGMTLVRDLVAAGHIVSIGHSGATYEEAQLAIEAGVRHATHLFNRMSPMSHRSPGAPGAVLEAEQVVAEVICDGFHVHPALMRIAIRAKGIDGVMAITDGTAGSGLPVGSRTHLGGRPITVTDRTAVLDDGTLAGSVLTMDGAFRTLVQELGLPLTDAARLCATTPARQLALRDVGRLEIGAIADLAVLDGNLRVTQTFLRGYPYRNPAPEGFV